jgi:hypothetical protein
LPEFILDVCRKVRIPFTANTPFGYWPENAPAGSQDIAGVGELVRGRANIARGVMECEVFKVDAFAVDSQQCASAKSWRSIQPAPTLGQPMTLIETGHNDTDVESRPHQLSPGCSRYVGQIRWQGFGADREKCA